MNKKIKKRIDSFKYAFKGIGYIIKTQPNMQIHLIAAIIVILAGVFFKLSNIEWTIIVIAISIVLITETINTAIEYFVDLVSPDYNKKAGLIKDLAAGAVLFAAIGSLIIGIIIFLPKILKLINRL